MVKTNLYVGNIMNILGNRMQVNLHGAASSALLLGNCLGTMWLFTWLHFLMKQLGQIQNVQLFSLVPSIYIFFILNLLMQTKGIPMSSFPFSLSLVLQFRTSKLIAYIKNYRHGSVMIWVNSSEQNLKNWFENHICTSAGFYIAPCQKCLKSFWTVIL